ncbi:MAG: decaprenyl-phosphate phosphoribosyltransferase [Planctomycetota bacterium]
MPLIALLHAMRPRQWVKNVFVLAPLLFAWGEKGREFLNGPTVSAVLFTLVAFCLTSSAIYLVNDLHDVESDRQHPIKRLRPIAAGTLAPGLAKVGVVAAGTIALILAWLGGPQVLACIAAYLVINSMYSWKWKHVALLDVFCIAAGFLLRVLAGGFAVNVQVSHWLLLCTIFLALFLALCKRQAEIDLLGHNRGEHRKILLEYTPEFLGQAVSVLAGCAILSYAMYTVAEETEAKFGKDHGLWWTVPFVVFGLLRYLLLVQTKRGGGNPTKVLLGGDWTFVGNALLWLATVIYLLARAHG